MKIKITKSAIRAKNPAVIRSTGQTNLKKIELPLFTNVENASWATQRILAELSYPLAVLSLTVNRKAARFCPGDLFVLNYAPYNISNMVMRVLSIEEQNLTSEQLEIKVMQDINYVASIPIIIGAEGQAEEPNLNVSPFIYLRVTETPYTFSESPNSFLPIVARVTGTETGMLIYGSVDAGHSYKKIGSTSQFSTHGVLTSTLLTSETSFTVNITIDAYALILNALAMFEKTNQLLIDDEVICFETIEPQAGTENGYIISDLHRGLYDTAIVDHIIDADFFSLDGLTPFTWPAMKVGTGYYFKFVPYNGCTVGDLSEALETTLNVVEPSLCPRSVIDLEANGVASGATYTGDIELTWTPRFRGSDVIPSALEYCDGLFEVAVIAAKTFTVVDASFTSSHDVVVPLAHSNITSGTVVVTTTDGNTTYTEDTDYTIDYTNGTITVLSTGAMADATEYYIDYDYIVENSIVRTAVTTPEDPFFNSWTYTEAMNLEDNTTLADTIIFQVKNFRDSEHKSESADIVVTTTTATSSTTTTTTTA